MKQLWIIAAAPVLTALAWGAAATAQEPITTVDRGTYVCELPGDAAGRVGQEQAGENFTIANSSRYESGKGGGTYLRRGERLTFTSGPRQGESYAVVSNGFLRRIESGQPGRLRCVRQGS